MGAMRRESNTDIYLLAYKELLLFCLCVSALFPPLFLSRPLLSKQLMPRSQSFLSPRSIVRELVVEAGGGVDSEGLLLRVRQQYEEAGPV